MSLWIILLIAALIAAVVGFVTVAKWLFIIALVLLVAGIIGLFVGRSAP